MNILNETSSHFCGQIYQNYSCWIKGRVEVNGCLSLAKIYHCIYFSLWWVTNSRPPGFALSAQTTKPFLKTILLEIFRLFVHFTSHHLTFEVYLRSDISFGALIMTYSRPLLWAAYEIIEHWEKSFRFSLNRTWDLSIMIRLS